MKVLFVGEGPHEIGHSDTHPDQPRPASGVLFALAKRVSAGISEESVALQWRDIVRFRPEARKHGFVHKVAAAVFLSHRKFGCGGTICVCDRDGDTDRLTQMEAGRERGFKLVTAPHHVICAVAVESIEAWTLGAPTALATHLEIEVSAIRKMYHTNHVETFKETSEKVEKQPKTILQRVAELGNQADSTEFRVYVAACTDVEELKSHCKEGFLPFADALIASFGRPSREKADNDG